MNRDIIVKDNFLPISFFRDVQNYILSQEIEWRFHKNATDQSNFGEEEDYYLAHTAYVQTQNNIEPTISRHFNRMQPILYFIEDRIKFQISNLIRMNFTLINQRKINALTKYHIDYNIPHHTAILYLNTCDGPTMIEGKEIDFIENRIVFFNGELRHAAVTQTNSICRANIVLNVNGIFF